MTPERIAEIEATIALRPNDVHVIVTELLTEMCRLARLGLRVEAAPVQIIEGLEYNADGTGEKRKIQQRVALVVLEDSE